MFEKIRHLTSGESHGQALVSVLEGMPSNLPLIPEDINRDLSRRQKGYGRGGRMKIESDCAQIISGVRHGRTLGSPIALLIRNRDWENWQAIMNPEPVDVASLSSDARAKTVTRPRPGHADLTGALKYAHRDLRNVLERSSARETAARVALGAVARKFLAQFSIQIFSAVLEIGGTGIKDPGLLHCADTPKLEKIHAMAERSPVRCPDPGVEERIIKKIDAAMKKGDTLGGVFQVVISGVPAGLGTYGQWDRKLEARLSYALMGIQAIKGVEIGSGFETARNPGSRVMDEIFYKTRKGRAAGNQDRGDTAGGFYRKTNHAGGIEGGMSNGMPIVLRAAMKPIPTLRSPLSSVDIESKKKFKAAYERSDSCAVPAASVIGEAAVALVLADVFLAKFGGDSMEELKRNYRGYLNQLGKF